MKCPFRKTIIHDKETIGTVCVKETVKEEFCDCIKEKCRAWHTRALYNRDSPCLLMSIKIPNV